MAEYERPPTKYQKDNHLDSSGQSRKPADIDSYDTHGLSLRSSRQERIPHESRSQTRRLTDRGRHHSQSNNTSDKAYHRYDKPEDRYSDSITKHYHWISHDRPKTIYSHIHERDMSNGHRMTNLDVANERRGQHSPIHRQDTTVEKPHERYDRRDEERRRHRDSEHFLQKSHYRYNKEAEQEYQESRSPACAHSYSSDVTSLKAGHNKLNIDDLDEQTDQQQRSTADHRSEHRHHRSRYQNSSRGRPSSRESSSHTSSNASQDSHDSRVLVTPKEGSSSRRRPSQHSWDRSRSRSQRRSPSHSGSRPRSESRHRGRSRSRSPSQHYSSVNKHGESSHGGKHSNKRKHKDRSASRDGRKRRRDKEREGEREKGREKEREREKKGEREREREKEKRKKRDDERRSVLTGKKIKLKVKKDKGDHERDANRKDLLQFLNSAFE